MCVISESFIRFAETDADVQYGHPFVARCSNDVPEGEAWGRHVRCAGTLTFGPHDQQAACGTCRAWCGRLVAHWP